MKLIYEKIKNYNGLIENNLPIAIVLGIFYDKIFAPLIFIWLLIRIVSGINYRSLTVLDWGLVAFIVINFLRLLSIEYLLISYYLNALSEIKLLLFLTLLILTRHLSASIFEKLKITDVTIGFIVTIILLGSYVISEGGSIIRFADSSPVYITSNSIYVGVVAMMLIIASPIKFKVPLIFTIIINLSTTPLLGLYTHLLALVKDKKIIALITTLFIIFIFVSQMLRGRDISEFLEWDRVQLAIAYYKSHISLIDPPTFIFGQGPVIPLGDQFIKNISNDKVANYVILETQPQFSSILHNEYLRIFHSYGLSGLFIISFIIYRALKIVPLFFPPLIFMMMTNSILYVTSIMIIILLISILCKREGVSENNCNYSCA